MRLRLMILVVMLAVVACGGDDASPDDAGGEIDTGSDIVIASIDFGAGTVTLRNDGAAAYDLSGHFLCNRPTYIEVPGGELAPGATVDVAFGLDASDGEMALYTSRSFDDPDAMLRYVQWGGDQHGRTATAVAAGVWQEGDTVTGGASVITSSGDNPSSAADWSG